MDGSEIREREDAEAPTQEAAPIASAAPAAPVDEAVAGDAAPTEAAAPAPEAPAPTPGTPTPAAEGVSDNGADAASDVSLMEQFLNDPSHDYKTLKYGDVMDGIIMHVDRDELLVDIGSKAEGIVPSREYSTLAPEEKQALQVGDTVLVFVVQPENQEGHPVVSIDRARQEKSWRRLQEIHEANEVIEAEVTNYNKGGLLVNLDGVRGFVPASQVTEIRGGDEASKQADMARLIGSTLPLKVIEINRHRNRLILSERQAIQERRDVMKEKLIEELKEGEVRKGRVSSICDFGAFVDIGGADGLVHLSELSWSRVRHPSEVLRVGQEVDVYVLGINAQEKKIALSIKRTQAEPWSRVAAKYEVGQLVRGTVTQLANFGAFARIEDGIEGLIHVSELADERITHPKQVVGEGQQLILRIIRIDPQRRRMGLSLRRALDTPDGELLAALGPEGLEERDLIAQHIRQAIEAEGLEPGGPPARSDRAAAEHTTGEDTVTVEEGPAHPQPAVADRDAAIPGDPAAASEADVPAPVTLEMAEPIEQAVTGIGSPDTVEAAEAAAGQPAPTGRRAPRTREERPQPELPEELQGEDLTPMAMAFALAGRADLVEEATEEDEPTEPGESGQ
jgi:small subunit ribosomal protein S1